MKPGNKSLLCFTATGSVDDGKSTLIGRLLYETRSIYADQYDAIRKTSRRRGFQHVELSYLLDGLAAEREQGITIDVAYRYFETQNRKFIIADTPGHVQYTRNMVTGASKADCAIMLIDARNGVLTQSKRHGFILSLLQIPHLIIAVNKMDLVDYSQDVFDDIVEEYESYSQKLDISDIAYIPVSALRGDNVVSKSRKMPWYSGRTLLQCLENIHVSASRNLVDFRFPVQYVVRPHQDFRGFAGKISSGTITPGEEVVILPSGKTASIKSITTYDGELAEAFVPQSVILSLDEEVDVSRGDMIVRRKNLPRIENSLEAMICWFDEKPMSMTETYILKHTTRSVKASVARIIYRIDVDTLHRQPVDTFQLNDIGRVEIKTAQPIFYDLYKINSATGSFILMDPLTNHTVAAGMIRDVPRHAEDYQQGGTGAVDPCRTSPNVVWRDLNVSRSEREAQNGHKACVLWFTGLSGSGKSTIAKEMERRLFVHHFHTVLLDGDSLRHGLCSDLAFAPADRKENIRRAGETARLFFEQGNIVLCSFISPFRQDRLLVRRLFPEGSFFEIYIQCNVNECMRRDPHGLYKRALTGSIENFTAVHSPYEAPDHPEIIIDTENTPLAQCVEKIERHLAGILMINQPGNKDIYTE